MMIEILTSRTFIVQGGKVPERILSSISAQILQGLVYLHRSRHTVRFAHDVSVT